MRGWWWQVPERYPAVEVGGTRGELVEMQHLSAIHTQATSWPLYVGVGASNLLSPPFQKFDEAPGTLDRRQHLEVDTPRPAAAIADYPTMVDGAPHMLVEAFRHFCNVTTADPATLTKCIQKYVPAATELFEVSVFWRLSSLSARRCFLRRDGSRH